MNRAVLFDFLKMSSTTDTMFCHSVLDKQLESGVSWNRTEQKMLLQIELFQMVGDEYSEFMFTMRRAGEVVRSIATTTDTFNHSVNHSINPSINTAGFS